MFFSSSKFYYRCGYDSDEPISNATLNHPIEAAVKLINYALYPDADEFQTFSVHDLCRTFSTRLDDPVSLDALIEACLPHQKKDQMAAGALLYKASRTAACAHTGLG